MEKEYKETLKQQLQLLSESSKNADPDELVALTDCMIRVYQAEEIDPESFKSNAILQVKAMRKYLEDN